MMPYTDPMPPYEVELKDVYADRFDMSDEPLALLLVKFPLRFVPFSPTPNSWPLNFY